MSDVLVFVIMAISLISMAVRGELDARREARAAEREHEALWMAHEQFMLGRGEGGSVANEGD